MIRIFGRIAVLALVVWGALWLLVDPRSPLPGAWNPVPDLVVADEVTWFTAMKLRRAVSSEAQCLAALSGAAAFEALPPKVESAQCGIDPRVRLTGVGGVVVRPVETTCAVALRLAMWERHVVQPAAEAILGQGVAELRHQGSYNCRPIRGSTTRMSTHATAEAIDIRGVVLADGTGVNLLGNWDGAGDAPRFWRALHAGACAWFVTVLGPDFNAGHADHFHMQSAGWGSCR